MTAKAIDKSRFFITALPFPLFLFFDRRQA
jgi:hypothetical protein